MNLSARLLAMFGWKAHITVPDYGKCIICVAPHTSNWDFIIGKLAYMSVGRHAGFLMKKAWFFPPLGWLFKAMGGIPVPSVRGASLTDAIVARFEHSTRMQLAITPEGTRSRTDRWRTGFLHIAYAAHLPVVLGVIDYATKTVTVSVTYVPTGDIDKDMRAIKDYYLSTGARGRYPDKFCAT